MSDDEDGDEYPLPPPAHGSAGRARAMAQVDDAEPPSPPILNNPEIELWTGSGTADIKYFFETNPDSGMHNCKICQYVIMLY